MTPHDALNNLGKALVSLDPVLFWWRASEPRTVELWRVKALLREAGIDNVPEDPLWALIDAEERKK